MSKSLTNKEIALNLANLSNNLNIQSIEKNGSFDYEENFNIVKNDYIRFLKIVKQNKQQG